MTFQAAEEEEEEEDLAYELAPSGMEEPQLLSPPPPRNSSTASSTWLTAKQVAETLRVARAGAGREEQRSLAWPEAECSLGATAARGAGLDMTGMSHPLSAAGGGGGGASRSISDWFDQQSELRGTGSPTGSESCWSDQDHEQPHQPPPPGGGGVMSSEMKGSEMMGELSELSEMNASLSSTIACLQERWQGAAIRRRRKAQRRAVFAGWVGWLGRQRRAARGAAAAVALLSGTLLGLAVALWKDRVWRLAVAREAAHHAVAVSFCGWVDQLAAMGRRRAVWEAAGRLLSRSGRGGVGRALRTWERWLAARRADRLQAQAADNSASLVIELVRTQRTQRIPRTTVC